MIRIFSSKRNFSVAKEMEWKYQESTETNTPDRKSVRCKPEELWEVYFPGFLILILFPGMDLRIITDFKLEPKKFKV